jgi:hypothetical protein
MPRAILDEAHIHPDARERVASYHSAVVQEVRDAIAASDIVVVGMRMNPWPKKARRLLDAAGLAYKYLEYGSYLGEWRVRLAIKMWPRTSAPRWAAGMAVVPSPQPRSSTFMPFVTPRLATSASPLARMVSAMRVKSPFSQRALLGLAGWVFVATAAALCMVVPPLSEWEGARARPG